MEPTIVEAQQEAKDKAKGQRAENPYQKGSRAYEMYENNPWTAEKFTREKTGWDTFLNAWGIRSGYDAAYDEWLAAGNEYDAQIAEIDAADKYNSPTEQAARMRAAGQNPDLLGTQGVAEAEEFANKEEKPNINAGADLAPLEIGAKALTGIAKGLTFGLSTARTIVENLNALEKLQETKLGNTEKWNNIVNDFLDKFTLSGYVNGKENDEFNFADIAGEVKENAKIFAKEHGFNQKMQERFGEEVYDALNGKKKAEIYKQWTDLLEARKQFGQTKASKYTPQNDQEEQVIGVVKDLVQEIDKKTEYNTKKEATQAEKDYEFQKGRNVTLEVQAHNQENKRKADQARIQTEVRKSFELAKRKLNQIKGKNGEPSVFAIIMNSVLSAVEMQVVN